MGQTDFTILQEAGFRVLAPKGSPAIVDSVAAVNRKLENALGEVGLLVDRTCTGLITSLERTSWVEKRPETATIDKAAGVEHFSDGLRYLVNYLWPITTGRRQVVQSGRFV